MGCSTTPITGGIRGNGSAQVASYEAILKAGSKNDFREHKTAIHFPGKELIEYSNSGFKALNRMNK